MVEIDKTLPKSKRIMLAAANVFSRKGYLQATLDEIIEIADTGKGTVYNYFKNKDNLFYTLVSEINAPFVANLKAIEESSELPSTKLEKYLQEFLDFLYINGTLWQVLFYEMSGVNRGWYFLREKGKEDQLIVKWGAQPTADEMERVKRYAEIIYASARILENILQEGVDTGVFKQSPVGDGVQHAARHLYGGVAMAVFFGKESQGDSEKLAKIIADRFLCGFAKPQK
ncbi:MAG: TetR/AcrR family transcriptional regulator [Negativicutes bacterium]|nr:TetR/AcrR family transcriptional regulator [Negativicutes bacterium]